MYMLDSFGEYTNTHTHNIRNKEMSFKMPPRCQTNVGLNTFQCTGIKCWNGLPSHIRIIKNNKTFKAKSKQHLLNEMFNDENNKFIYY